MFTTVPPTLSDERVVLDYRALRYNPCDDLIFPSVIRAKDYLPDALDTYYLYYSPHNGPGGVCLATAPSLEGPWTEYGANPLVGNVWAPHYDVHHVSSPHVVWVAEAGRFFLHYHGDNDATRCASSPDGIHFDYEGIALSTADFAEADAVFYARAFHLPALTGGDGYALLTQVYHQRHHGIYVARSTDARTWTVDLHPLLAGPAIAGARYIWSPYLVRWNERLLLAYHADFFGIDDVEFSHPQSDIYVSEVNDTLTESGPPYLLCPRTRFGLKNERVADPCLVSENGQLYLFASIGPRLNQVIASIKVEM